MAAYVKFGEVVPTEKGDIYDVDTGLLKPEKPSMTIKLPDNIAFEQEDPYSREEEDALVVAMSAQFADWVAAFLRRVILLFEVRPMHHKG